MRVRAVQTSCVCVGECECVCVNAGIIVVLRNACQSGTNKLRVWVCVGECVCMCECRHNYCPQKCASERYKQTVCVWVSVCVCVNAGIIVVLRNARQHGTKKLGGGVGVCGCECRHSCRH